MILQAGGGSRYLDVAGPSDAAFGLHHARFSSVVILLVGDMVPRQHSIMQDANDKNALRRRAVEDDMTTNFQTPEAKSNIVAGMPDARVVGQRLATCFKSV